nr:hypothetical protein [Tanacetum cinerariifolium]
MEDVEGVCGVAAHMEQKGGMWPFLGPRNSSKPITMSTLNFAEVHNMIAFLSKSTESAGFEQIIDFLNAHPIKYSLTVNPTIYNSCVEQFWGTTKVNNINGEAQLHAKVDGKKVVISGASIRRDI